MATELGKNFFAGRKASQQFQGDSRRQAEADWGRSFYGQGGTTPLSEFQKSKNTRYAMDHVGWDKAQGLRQKAEAADVGAVAPTGGNKWDRRYNYANDEMEWVEKGPSNFWKANKEELIPVLGSLAGGIIGSIVPVIGTGYGASLGYSLTKTGRDIKKMRDARRDFRDDKREWEYEQMLAQQDAARYGPQRGNLFKNIGEGTVEWATKDVERNKRKGTYERGAV